MPAFVCHYGPVLGGEMTLYEQVKASLDGGITLLQLREKDMPDDEFLREAKDMKALAASYRVPFIINDNVGIALAVDADGYMWDKAIWRREAPGKNWALTRS